MVVVGSTLLGIHHHETVLRGETRPARGGVVARRGLPASVQHHVPADVDSRAAAGDGRPTCEGCLGLLPKRSISSNSLNAKPSAGTAFRRRDRSPAI